ncbi:DUF6318 family protein [Terrabacter sp. NPDC000476]|uniref:DUF6318 family protein n=1 Tax=Terrabacter sp. NPDC000476 TaxID=3154258 RepID=UPI00332F8F37
MARIPAAARQNSIGGAAAFGRFYFEQLSRAFQQGSPSSLDGLFAPSCQICVSLSESAAQLERAGQHHAGTTLRVTFSSATVFNSKSRQVLVRLEQFSVPVVDKTGKKVDTTKAGSGAFVAVLSFDKHWVVQDLGRPA